MESQKLEQSSVPLPDDPAWESSKKFLDEHQHCHPHTEAVSDCFRCNWRYFRNVSIERIASLTAQVATLGQEKAAAHGARFAEARNHLKDYFAKHGMGVKDVIQSQWARGVHSGRQEAINVLDEAIRSLSAPTKEQQGGER